MKTLTFQQPHNLNKITDELFAAFPSWRTPATFGGIQGFVTNVVVQGDGATLTLVVPDDADVSAVAAVVQAHNPVVVPVTPVNAFDDVLAAVDADPSTDITPAERGFFHKVRDLLGGKFAPSTKPAASAPTKG